MKHALSFDVESYHSPKQTLKTTILILNELKKFKTKATFFILGSEVKYYHKLVKRLEDDGHEIGLHGYFHYPLSVITSQSFADSLKRGLDELHRQTSSPILGFRAPYFSLSHKTNWFLDTLAEMGFIYDSSLFPHSGRSKIFGGNIGIFRLPNGLYEVPLTVLNFMGLKIPICGGGYLRYFPYWFTKIGLLLRQHIHLPAVIYMHPYEFDLPFRNTSFMNNKIRDKGIRNIFLSIRIHPKIVAINQGKNQLAKFHRLLNEFNFAPIKEILSSNISGLQNFFKSSVGHTR